MNQPPAPPIRQAPPAQGSGPFPPPHGYPTGHGATAPTPNGPGSGHFGPPPGWAPTRPPVAKPTVFAGLLQVLALVLVPLGAALPFGENFASSAMWASSTTWAGFAAVAAVVQLAPLLGRITGRQPAASWRAGAVGVGSLIGFWVLIVLPAISTGQNFVVTLGVFAAATGLWLSPGRQL